MKTKKSVLNKKNIKVLTEKSLVKIKGGELAVEKWERVQGGGVN